MAAFWTTLWLGVAGVVFMAGCTGPQERTPDPDAGGGAMVDLPPPRPERQLPEVVVTPGPQHALHHVFSLLERREQGEPVQISVLHMGASHTASDTVTGPLRVAFAERFGDAGRGFIQPGEPWRRFRQLSATHDMGGEWEVHHGMQRDGVPPFGLGGVRIQSSEPGAWFVRGTCADCRIGQSMSGFTLHYLEQTAGGSFRIYVDEVLLTTISTRPGTAAALQPVVPTAPSALGLDPVDLIEADILGRGELPAELLEGEFAPVDLPEPGVPHDPSELIEGEVVYNGAWYTDTLPEGHHTLRFEVVGDGPVAFTGVTTTSGEPGVRYTSIGLNGSQGGHFLGFDEALSIEDARRIAPDLVVFAWGINETYSDRYRPEDLNAPPEEWLERAERHTNIYVDLMARIRQAQPLASCVMLLPTDLNPDDHPARPRGSPRCAAEPDGWIDRDACTRALPRTHPYIRAAQLEAARRAGCATWDQQAAMGGVGGMALWQVLDPPLAGSDGIHLTATGYESLALGFFGDFMDAWEHWRIEPDPEARLETRTIRVLPDDVPDAVSQPGLRLQEYEQPTWIGLFGAPALPGDGLQ